MVLAGDKNTKVRDGHLLSIPVAADTVIYAGALVAVNAAGYAIPGTESATIKAAGRAEKQVNNTGGQAGEQDVLVRRGVFLFENSASADEITEADLLNDCYIVDDETVAKTDDDAGRSVAGKVLGVDDDGVWVEIGTTGTAI